MTIYFSIYELVHNMHRQIPFSSFGGGGGPSVVKQLCVIFGVWATAKLWLRRPRGGNGKHPEIAHKYNNPKLLSH